MPEGMVIEKKLPDLLFLLESHTGTTNLEIPIVPRPSTPIPLAPVQTKAADKKGKRDKIGGKRPIKEGEVQEEALPEPTKVAKVTRAQQRRGVESSDVASERRSRVSNWNPVFELDGSPLREDASICNFDGGRVGYMANAVEQALLLSNDMDELRNLKKHVLFLSVKKDLALVRFLYSHFFFKL